jgi:hypothetical protein
VRSEQVGVREAPVPPGTMAAPHGGRVLMLPGRGYSCEMPLLHRTTRALQASGWRVLQASWELGDLPSDPRSFVTEVAQRLQDAATPPDPAAAPEAATRPDAVAGPHGAPVVVVAKSLGTHAAPWAAERGYPAAWLTPVPTDPGVRAALQDYPAASLVVGGTADPLWEVGFAGSGRVMQIDGADHSLELPDWRATIEIHREVAEAVVALAATALARPA